MGDSVRGEKGEEEAFVALFSREMTPFASHCELNRACQGVYLAICPHPQCLLHLLGYRKRFERYLRLKYYHVRDHVSFSTLSQRSKSRRAIIFHGKGERGVRACDVSKRVGGRGGFSSQFSSINCDKWFVYVAGYG